MAEGLIKAPMKARPMVKGFKLTFFVVLQNGLIISLLCCSGKPEPILAWERRYADVDFVLFKRKWEETEGVIVVEEEAKGKKRIVEDNVSDKDKTKE